MTLNAYLKLKGQKSGKELYASLLTSLFPLLLIAPAWAGIPDFFLQVEGVEAECVQAQAALLDLKDPSSEVSKAPLLPAVQKASMEIPRARKSCGYSTGAIGANCVATTLSEAILDSQAGRDGSPGLLNLVAEATGTHIKKATLFVRKSGGEGATGAEKLILAVLIGLVHELEDAKIGDRSVMDPLRRAIAIAESIDPNTESAADLTQMRVGE